MKRQKGYTILEMAIVFVIIMAAVLVVLGEHDRAEVRMTTEGFRKYFVVDLKPYAKAGQPPDTWLSIEQKQLLFPWVEDRIVLLCARHNPPKPVTPERPAAMSPEVIQFRLTQLEAQRTTAESVGPQSAACSEAVAVAAKLDLLDRSVMNR